MGRQILAVMVGVLLSVLTTAAGGFLVYQLSTRNFQSGPVLARYVLSPIIAMLVGMSVGALAKSRPALLAALSLVPSSIILLLFKRLSFTNLLLMIFLVAVNLLIGAVVATLTFRGRTRATQVAPIGR